MGLVRLLTAKLEGVAELVRRSHHDAIEELQGIPILGGVLIKNVSFPAATDTPVAHRLGRRPVGFFVQPPYGASSPSSPYFADVTPDEPTFDPKQFVVIRANGWGATVTTNVFVF